MTKSVFTAILFILALSGCAQTNMIEKGQTTGDYYRNVNEQCQGGDAVLTLQDSSSFKVYNVNVGPDTTSWMDIADGKIKSVQTSNVYSIKVKDRTAGFLYGLGWGLLCGAVAGRAYGYATDPQELNGGPALGLVGGAVVGLCAGSFIGVVLGQPSYFIINEKVK